MTAHIFKVLQWNKYISLKKYKLPMTYTYILSSYIPIHIENRDDAYDWFDFFKDIAFWMDPFEYYGHVYTYIRTYNERALLVIVASIIRDDLRA